MNNTFKNVLTRNDKYRQTIYKKNERRIGTFFPSSSFSIQCRYEEILCPRSIYVQYKSLRLHIVYPSISIRLNAVKFCKNIAFFYIFHFIEFIQEHRMHSFQIISCAYLHTADFVNLNNSQVTMGDELYFIFFFAREKLQ